MAGTKTLICESCTRLQVALILFTTATFTCHWFHHCFCHCYRWFRNRLLPVSLPQSPSLSSLSQSFVAGFTFVFAIIIAAKFAITFVLFQSSFKFSLFTAFALRRFTFTTIISLVGCFILQYHCSKLVL